MTNPPLLSIIAHARSGATEQAWRMFREAGLDGVDDDPAVLSVLGRLLKDRARAAKAAERRRHYKQAADAYARAAAISGANYPLINAATLSLLAGERRRARSLARQVLERSLGGENEPDTPYWHAATRVEARLLLGEVAQAKRDLAQAMSLAPQAYEDHASTLRQLALILDEMGEDKSWLDPCRPPRSLHFAGHMALPSKDGALGRDIRAFLARERVGFGYGALAAGADILIAEALLETGAELHLVLPAAPEEFRRASVAAFGRGWARRFDAIMDRAATRRSVARDADPLSPLAIRLAAEISMGASVMQAEMLATEAVQLLILSDGRRDGGVSEAVGSQWRAGKRRQHVLLAPRKGGEQTSRRRAKQDANACLAAMLRIDLSLGDAGRVPALLPRLLPARIKPLLSPCWTGEELLVAFAGVSDAAKAALSAMEALDGIAEARIAAHYAVVDKTRNPFGGAKLLTGDGVRVLGDILRSTPPGAIHVSEDFAAALHGGRASGRPRTEFIGELPGEVDDPTRLHSLRR